MLITNEKGEYISAFVEFPFFSGSGRTEQEREGKILGEPLELACEISLMRVLKRRL